VWKQRVVLKDHRGRPTLGWHVVDPSSPDQEVAAGNFLKSRDHAQRGGLAAAGRPEKGDELAFLDVEIEIHDRRRPVLIDFADMSELKIKIHEWPVPYDAITRQGRKGRRGVRRPAMVRLRR